MIHVPNGHYDQREEARLATFTGSVLGTRL